VDIDRGPAPDGHVVEHRPSPAHRAVPRIGGARPRVALAIALGMGLVAVGIAVNGHGPERAGAAASAAAPAPASAAPASAPAAAGFVVATLPARGDLHPTEVRVPSLGVRSALVDLDVGPDGALAPPVDPDVAGWYVRGGVPGLPGPTVIAGHVDSRSGPAVFYRLDELAAGDRVEVTRSDGQVFAYRVSTVETHPKDAFPTARVYGPTPGPELRLITCGGEFDRGSRHYRDNVIVTAIPVG
jgi:Sortase domain